MARTALTKTTLEGPYGDYGVGEADITMAAGDAVNGNEWAFQEGDILIAHNTNVGAQTVTIDSVADPSYGREGDITTYSLAADDYAAFGPFKGGGWRQSDGTMHVDVSHADIKLGVLAQ